MARKLTRSYRDTIAEAAKDPEFRLELLTGAMDALLASEVEDAKAYMRSYVNATIGFEKLAEMTGGGSKSLMRMLSAEGNPKLNNLVGILSALQANEGVTFTAVAHHGGQQKDAPALTR